MASRWRRSVRSGMRVGANTSSRALWRLSAAAGADSPLGKRFDRLASGIQARSVRLQRTAPSRRRHRLADKEANAVEHWRIVAIRARQRVEVEQPLLLISQIHRSGGTLLLRLFDGHGQCHTVPHELGSLLPASPVPLEFGEAWDVLTDVKLERRFRKTLTGDVDPDDPSTYRVLIPPRVVRGLFKGGMKRRRPASEREVLNEYLTAYFNGWLDNRNLYLGDKRLVVGFEPGAISQPERMERFFRLYPDGRLLSVIRDPWSWYASARRWSPRFENLEVALTVWAEAAEAAVGLEDRFPERVRLVHFESLIGSTTDEMRRIADFAGVDFTDELLRPTVNGLPVVANSSFGLRDVGISQDPVARRRDLLTADESARIEERARETYDRVFRSAAGSAAGALTAR